MSARRRPSRSSASYNEPPLKSPDPAIDDDSTSPHRTSLARRSPFLPTRLELLLLSIYPATLVLGSVFSIVSPTTRNAPYSSVSQSHPVDQAPSYFAQKKNIFNVFFVKKGWAWTTGAMFLFLLTHPSLGPPMRPVLTPRRVRGALRWALVTLAWVFVTQWFFGPPLIDTLFRFTGGQCELVRDPDAREAMSDTREFITSATCKVAGGTWKGGHDISGHVFLLILGSMLLWFEILPAVLRAEGLRDGRRIVMFDGKTRTAGAEAQRESHAYSAVADAKDPGLGVKASLAVMALSWWMLLMTAAFFHTWFEKFTGLLVAFSAIWLVYFLPRGVPAYRAVIGMPGV
ncbi:putative inositol phospholipid synthesis protein scs3p protein [Neofusicoccum parvum UCRNP2]|uniref:Acyl-coenzyme A diphosphatase SCS3 n=1 Tax=Botryosphaeria parva (strain UCR-NP2) TaxID=1287680 RepID=R1EZ60_BOTPV|nr:putative inositol phospholipid synthesis protein scs3p protein [Neofusicoccum parvum UCRNP2]